MLNDSTELQGMCASPTTRCSLGVPELAYYQQVKNIFFPRRSAILCTCSKVDYPCRQSMTSFVTPSLIPYTLLVSSDSKRQVGVF